MDLTYAVENGLLTAKALEKLIDDNQALANKLRFRLQWYFDKGDFVSRIYERDNILLEKKYDYKYTHINIMWMHYEWKNFLEHTWFLRKPQPPKDPGKGRKGEGDRHWAETTLNNKLNGEHSQQHPDTDYSNI